MEKDTLEIIAIDESGISSKIGYSVYAFIFIPIKDYTSISNHIIRIEKELGIDYIHRSEMSWKLRMQLAYKLIFTDFKVHVVTYTNPVLPDKTLIHSIFHVFSKIKHVDKILIDGKRSKIYKSKIKKIFKNHIIKTHRIKFIDDTSEPILRLADFIAGSIRSYLDDSKNIHAKNIYQTFKNKIATIYKAK